MATLFLSLPVEALQASSALGYVLSPDGQGIGLQSSVPLSLLSETLGERISTITHTVVIVPTAQLSWHRLTLPIGALAGRQRAVLEGLLEEQVLDDPTHLHFALAPHARAGIPVWVAVCNKAWLRQAIDGLELAGLSLDRIVPETTPTEQGASLCAIGSAEEGGLLHASTQGVTRWPLTAASVALLAWPSDAPLEAEPAVAARAENLFGRPVTLLSPGQRANDASQSPWDLGQLGMSVSKQTRILKRISNALSMFATSPRWRPTRWGLLVLLAVNVVGLNVRAFQERSAINAQRLAMAAVVTETFPKVSVVVDAPIQMQREINALQIAKGQTSGHSFESLLGVLMASLSIPGQPTPTPTTIDFSNGQLQVTDLTINPQTWAQAQLKLQAQGYLVRQSGDIVVIQAKGAMQ
jgi:general secretion pathway protein L